MATTYQPAGLTASALDALRPRLRGTAITAGSAEYDTARLLYNRMHDRHPALIVRCRDAGDVAATVAFARETGLPLAVRGGGHNVAGLGSVDGGIVADLSEMNEVMIDPAAKTARAGGGALWGDVDHAAAAFGLATPGGVLSTTGVAGLTLGGGFGHLTRRWGLCADNLLSAQVVTADGSIVTASASSNPDLYWAIRGGGGNFGVATELTLQLHEMNPTVYGGPIFFPMDYAEQVLRFYREFIAKAPREMGAFFGFHIAPPAPFVPEALHYHKACAIVVCYSGPAEQAEATVKPIREAAPVALDLCGPIPYPALNSMFDPLLPHGLQHYWKADFETELTDEAIAIHVREGAKIGNFTSLMHLYPLDGAVQDVANNATAFAHRDVKFVHIIAGIDSDPANMPAHTAWVRDYWAALHPYSAGGAYVNFLMDEGQDRIKATYRDNYARLVDTKRTWDPANFFHVNQNIRP